MSAIPTLSADRPPLLKIHWIIGRWTDLLFFIGAAVGGYAFFMLHVFSHSPTWKASGWRIDMVMIYFLWLALIDAPHFFGTYSRTYLDRQEMRQRRRLLLGSAFFLIAGPFVLLICYLLFRSGARNHYAPYAALGTFVGIWAYWHVVRQHYGIMSLYKRKNRDIARADRWIDNLLLYTGTLAPFVALIFRHPDARRELSSLAQMGFAVVGWSKSRTLTWFENTSNFVFYASVTVVCLAVGLFAARQVWRMISQQPLNLPKILFLLAVIPLHTFVLYHPAVLTAQLFMVAAFVTIFHDFQYHAIVWHYQQNRCHAPRDSAPGGAVTASSSRGDSHTQAATGKDRDYGWAKTVSKNPFVFFGCAIMMGIAGAYIGCKLDIVAGCSPLIPTSRMRLFGDIFAYELFASLMFGFLMHHYFVDQFIWRPSKDERLRKDLRINH